MNPDRRDAYYARSAAHRARCPLDFQRRYMAGLNVVAQMRTLPSPLAAWAHARKAPAAPEPIQNVVPMRKRQRRA